MEVQKVLASLMFVIIGLVGGCTFEDEPPRETLVITEKLYFWSEENKRLIVIDYPKNDFNSTLRLKVITDALPSKGYVLRTSPHSLPKSWDGNYCTITLKNEMLFVPGEFLEINEDKNSSTICTLSGHGELVTYTADPFSPDLEVEKLVSFALNFKW